MFIVILNTIKLTYEISYQTNKDSEVWEGNLQEINVKVILHNYMLSYQTERKPYSNQEGYHMWKFGGKVSNHPFVIAWVLIITSGP